MLVFLGSAVLKVDSHFEQWYYSLLEPWKHFIPVAGDLSDLCEKLYWATDPANDAAVKSIADEGRKLALYIVSDEFAEAYAIL